MPQIVIDKMISIETETSQAAISRDSMTIYHHPSAEKMHEERLVLYHTSLMMKS